MHNKQIKEAKEKEKINDFIGTWLWVNDRRAAHTYTREHISDIIKMIYDWDKGKEKENNGTK